MDALASLRKSTGVARCVSCGKCTSICPMGTRRGFSARLIAGQEVEEELQGRGLGIGRCLTCAACETRCPQGVEFTEFVRGMREMIPPQARRDPPHDGVFQSVSRSMVGDHEPTRDTSWLTDDLEVAEEGEIALFVGCLPFFDIYFQDLGVNTLEIARSAVRILNRLGIKPVLVEEERCCGHDLLWGGDRTEFEALARSNAKSFKARGVKRILTTCAECCRTWRIDYPEVVEDYQPKVEHLSEFLAARVGSGEIEFREEPGGKVTFQDPCRLARHLGVTESPRQVLGALPGTDVVEMGRSGKDALCCGTSGFIHCDGTSRGLQQKRLQEAAETGAETLVTACPKCLIHLSCAQDGIVRNGGRKRLQIQDFTVLAAGRLQDVQDKPEAPATTGRETGDVT